MIKEGDVLGWSSWMDVLGGRGLRWAGYLRGALTEREMAVRWMMDNEIRRRGTVDLRWPTSVLRRRDGKRCG